MGHLLTTLLITTSHPSIDTKCIYCLWVLGWPAFPRFQKLLEENTGRTLSDINHSKILYDPPPRVMEIKAKINKRDLLLLLSHFSRVRLCDPRDGSPPGFPVPGILQARTLEWVAISFSNA